MRLNPNGLRVWDDHDWPVWTVLSQASHSYTSNGVTFTLSTEGTTLKGARYKYVQQRAAAGMGEKMVGEAMSSDAESTPITLTIQGLSAGMHTLATWHNAPHKLASTAALAISVKGNDVLSVSGSRGVLFSCKLADRHLSECGPEHSSGQLMGFFILLSDL